VSRSEAVRGTQSFVHILRECWYRPSLVAREVLWCWLFGAPFLALLWYEVQHIFAITYGQLVAAGMYEFSLQDPMRAAVIIANMFSVLWPPVLQVVVWLAPVAMLGWSVASGIGRSVVLRHYDPSLPAKRLALVGLQLLRAVALGGSFVLWFAAIHWIANYSLGGEEPNLVVYCGLVICVSLGFFTVWALASWVFSIAPLLVLLEGRGVLASLSRSVRLGPLTGKLVEVNLVMGIVKLALIVLAMVFSATPLPFESVMQGAPLYLWWAFVSLLYLIASDFFQVARLVAFIKFWRLWTLSPTEMVNADLPAIRLDPS
jgi:hypothetical protein